jgi:SnoaL-like domain
VTEIATGVVERFFAHLTARDWGSLRAVLAPGVERIGPFGDHVAGRDRYVDLLAGTVPSEYGNDVLRVTYATNGRSAFARVTEHLHYTDRELHLQETYAFTIDDHGLLSRVEVYWQTPQLDPGGFGSARSEQSYETSREAPDADSGMSTR